MSEALKPCPFCDGRADIAEDSDRHGEEGRWTVFCATCDGCTGYCGSKAQAIAAWNTRADASAIKAATDERDRMERNRDMWKEQCERQARQLEAMHLGMRANMDVLAQHQADDQKGVA